jgi:hypothetical protein
MIQKIDNEIDLGLIQEELKVLPPYETQICLQGVEGSDDPFLGCGVDGGKNSWERKQTHRYRTRDFKFPIFDMPYLNGLLSGFGMTHTRAMILKPKTCYSYHKDRSKRIHIPVYTNEDCWLILNKTVFHAPADGNHYIVDTTNMHTAVNTSQEDRLHILGNINDT